jgi:streptomycin 6-kinase
LEFGAPIPRGSVSVVFRCRMANGRAERVAAATGTDPARLLGWCTAFAGMTALELASQGTGPRPRTEALLRLAAPAPTD